MTYPYQPGPHDPHQQPARQDFQQQAGPQDFHQQAGPQDFHQQAGPQEPTPPPADPPVQPYQPPYQQPPGFYAPPPTYSPYGYPASPYAYPATRPVEGLAIASLAVSCVSVLGLCFYGLGGALGIAGAVLGHIATGRIKTNGNQGSGMALAGIIVGWITTTIAAVVAILLVVWLTNADFS
jgi:hypothetical protein